MEHYSKERLILLITTLLLLLFICDLNVCLALDCELNFNDVHRVAYSIVVDHRSGRGHFSTIQSAIDSIPFQNTKWIRLQISPGIYREKVVIPIGKSCIFLDGAGRTVTEVQWNDHTSTASSATFTSFADNLVVQGITFRNTYNTAGSVKRRGDMKPALAARMEGDKGIFNRCGFVGLQDTLWDGHGRHHYTNCYIEGVIDVISGSAKSIFEKCVINIAVDLYAPVLEGGYITAQGKADSKETNGFVFIECSVRGSGRVFLGRAYGPFSTVIFYLSSLPSCIDPAGWSSWNHVGHERNFTYSETRCIGPGANTSRRVPWVKRLNGVELKRFTDISFIDQEGWTSKLPILSR